MNQHWSYMFGHWKNLSRSQGVYPSQKKHPPMCRSSERKIGHIYNKQSCWWRIYQSDHHQKSSLNPQTNVQFGMTMPWFWVAEKNSWNKHIFGMVDVTNHYSDCLVRSLQPRNKFSFSGELLDLQANVAGQSLCSTDLFWGPLGKSHL